MKKILSLAATCLMASLVSMHANAFEIGKPVAIDLPIQPGNKTALGAATKRVYVMGKHLTEQETKALFKTIHSGVNPIHPLNKENSKLAPVVNLGMNGVPVLDQGWHGSCVTFATTAAVDAALGKGDYISQLCQLELGAFLEKDSYMPSGWEGSNGPYIIDQMFRFGVVNKTTQQSQSCAGVKEYPTRNPSEGSPMSEDDYKSKSESLFAKGLYPVYLQTADDRYTDHFTEEDAVHNVNKAKEALARGERITFGANLFKIPHCENGGSCGKYHVTNDTWVITKEFYQDDGVPMLGGHELVIYGYDDNAVAVDHDGREHRGLFLVRNSWGADAGDKGEFYMSYDYFKYLVDEIQVIAHRTDS